MNPRVVALAAAIALAVPQAGTAGPHEDAIAAYERGDFAAALKLFQPLAEQGHAGAQANLGVMYATGRGVEQDFTQAVAWFRKAADQGDPAGQTNLGLVYYHGQGVEDNDSEAAIWWLKAAEQGYAPAQANLGLLYANGRGVLTDYVQAHKWLSLAATRFEPGGEQERAARTRELVARRMTPEQLAEAERLVRDWKPEKER